MVGYPVGLLVWTRSEHETINIFKRATFIVPSWWRHAAREKSSWGQRQGEERALGELSPRLSSHTLHYQLPTTAQELCRLRVTLCIPSPSMTAVEDHNDAMTASFSASAFDSEVHDPWTATPQGLSTVDLSTILCKSMAYGGHIEPQLMLHRNFLQDSCFRTHASHFPIYSRHTASRHLYDRL